MTDTSKNRPVYRAYTVTAYSGDSQQSRWTDIGVVWRTRDGKGLNLQLNALPIDGRIVLREFKDKSEQEAA